CSCCRFCTTITTSNISANLVHCNCVTSVRCRWRCKDRCCCALDCCICSSSSDHWRLCIYLCNCLGDCSRCVAAGIHSYPCSCCRFCTTVTTSNISTNLVHCNC